MPLGRTIRTSSQNHTVLYQSTYLLVCSPDVTKAKKLTHCAFNTLVTCR